MKRDGKNIDMINVKLRNRTYRQTKVSRANFTSKEDSTANPSV